MKNRRFTPSPPHPFTPSARKGVTLAEMLIVIGILLTLLGLGAASYFAMAKNYKEEGAAARLDMLIRQVRNSAVSTNAPAYLEIDAEHNVITPWATRTVALWHFEDTDEFGHTTGSRHNAALRGARIVEQGKIGKCARISASGYVDAGGDPDFDLDDGGTLEAYIRPAPQVFTGDSYIFSKSGAYGLKVAKNGILVGEIAGSGKVKPVRIFSKTYRIVPGRWTKVALSWDRNVTRVLADDQIVATGPGAAAPVSINPLMIGSDGGGLDGLVDEVRILSAVSGGTFELPKSFKITHNTEPWNAIYFAGDGTLDMRFHAGPVKITIEQDRRARAITINMFGTTTRQELEKLDKPPETSHPEELEKRRKEAAKHVRLE